MALTAVWAPDQPARDLWLAAARTMEKCTESTMNYTLSDFGDHYVITPRTYFDCKPGKARVALNREKGCVAIAPKLKPKIPKDQYACNTTKQILGGIIYLPKKADLSKEIEIDYEGPAKQVMLIKVRKVPQVAGSA